MDVIPQNKMAVMPMGRLLAGMSVPLILSLTAISLVFVARFLMSAVSVVTAVKRNVQLPRRVRQQKEEAACRAATTGLLLMLVTAMLFSVAGLLFSGAIARVMTEDPVLRELCGQYMRICMVWCHGIFIQTYGQRLLQTVGDTVLSIVSLMIGAALNIILDPILVFGYLGFPAMGIRCAAAATVIGQWLGAAAALLFNRRKNPAIHVRFRGYRFQWEDVREIYRVGMPTIVIQAMGCVMTFAVNAILITMSSTAVAFFGVYYKLQSFLMMPMNGLGRWPSPSSAITTAPETRTGSGRAGAFWSPQVSASHWLPQRGLLLPGHLLVLFAAGEEMRALGIPALRIVSVTFPCSVLTILCGYFASGLRNGVINMVGGAIRRVVVLVSFIWLFIRLFGVGGVWFAFWISEAAACAGTVKSYAQIRLQALAES